MRDRAAILIACGHALAFGEEVASDFQWQSRRSPEIPLDDWLVESILAFSSMHRTAEYRPSIAEVLNAADASMRSVFSFCACLPV